MKIQALNPTKSLKSIPLEFTGSSSEINQIEEKLQRIANKMRLSETQFLAFVDIFELRRLSKELAAYQAELEQILADNQTIWRGKNFNFGLTFDPIIYSILNVTPDSFFDGSKEHLALDFILKRVESDLENGAAVIELGGKSSRPGYQDISPQEEWERIAEPINQIKKAFPTAVLAVDTDEAFVMERVLDAGVDIINDIDGFDTDEKLKIIEDYQPSLVVMNNGRAGNQYSDNLFVELETYFKNKIKQLTSLGISPEQISIDTGVGFHMGEDAGINSIMRCKTSEIISRSGAAVMIAISQKRFMSTVMGYPDDERLFPTLMLESQMIADGGRILRVHDSKATAQMIEGMKPYLNY